MCGQRNASLFIFLNQDGTGFRNHYHRTPHYIHTHSELSYSIKILDFPWGWEKLEGVLPWAHSIPTCSGYLLFFLPQHGPFSKRPFVFIWEDLFPVLYNLVGLFKSFALSGSMGWWQTQSSEVLTEILLWPQTWQENTFAVTHNTVGLVSSLPAIHFQGATQRKSKSPPFLEHTNLSLLSVFRKPLLSWEKGQFLLFQTSELSSLWTSHFFSC